MSTPRFYPTAEILLEKPNENNNYKWARAVVLDGDILAKGKGEDYEDAWKNAQIAKRYLNNYGKY